jgi:hypothetical protein
MNPWIALGLFGLGAGAGSLASAILHADQIRKLKRLLNAAAHNTSQKEEDNESDRRKSA